MTFDPSPKPPEIQWSQPCRKCQGTLYRVTTGNLVDYRHAGGEFTCPTPQSLKLQKLSLEQLLENLVQSFKPEPTQAQFALDA